MIDVIRRRRLAFLVPIVLSILLATACSGATSFQPITRAGGVLTITVHDLERLPELRYSNYSQGRVLNHFRLAPTQEGSELVALRLKVGNHTAVTSIVSVDEQAAQLEDFFKGVYLPVNIAGVGEIWTQSDTGWAWVSNSIAAEALIYGEDEDVPDPPGWNDGPVRLIELRRGSTALPGQGFLVGSVEIPRGHSIDGWLVFEVPEGTEFSELTWRAADSIIIPF